MFENIRQKFIEIIREASNWLEVSSIEAAVKKV
jgi:hypothetical protein